MVFDFDCQLGVETLVQDVSCLLETRTVLLEELIHDVVDVGESLSEPVLEVVRLEGLFFCVVLSHLCNQLLALLDVGALIFVQGLKFVLDLYLLGVELFLVRLLDFPVGLEEGVEVKLVESADDSDLLSVSPLLPSGHFLIICEEDAVNRVEQLFIFSV